MHSRELLNRFRTHPTAFSRQRQLGFANLVGYLLNQIKGGHRRESFDFFEQVLDQAQDAVSGAAISKARTALDPNVFLELNRQVIEQTRAHLSDLEKWRGLSVFAVDGSVINLPESDLLRDHFQHHSKASSTTAPQARLSVLHEAVTGLNHHFILLPYTLGEGVGASEHLPHTPPQSVTLYDRGYASFWLFADHRHHQREFCARARRGFNNDVDDFFGSDAATGVFTMTPSADAKVVCIEQGVDYSPLVLRLVRVLLSTGETEVLITSLCDTTQYCDDQFHRLYAMRWSVETGYYHSKSRLQLENFSSRRVRGIYQDVYAKLLAQNLAQVVRLTAQCERQAHSPNRKYQQRTSFADTLHRCKHRLVSMLFRSGQCAELMDSLLDVLGRCCESHRPDRPSEARLVRSRLARFPQNRKATA